GRIFKVAVKIRENGGTAIVIGMTRVVDMECIDGDALRHVTGVTEVVLPVVGAADQAGADRFAAGWNKHGVADDDLALPCAAVVGAEIDQTPAVDGGVFDGEGSAADRVDSLMSQRGVANGGVGDSHVSVEAGKNAVSEE